MQITINKFLNMSNYKKIVVALSLVIMLCLAATCGMLFIMLKSDKIIKGTYIQDINVSSLTRDQARQAVEETYSKLSNNLKVTVKKDNDSNTFSFSELGLKPDMDGAVNEAYDIGRKGNTFSNVLRHFKSLYSTSNIHLKLSVSNESFNNFADKLDSKYKIDPVNWSLNIDGQNYVLTVGTNGKSVDRDKLYDLFVDNSSRFSDFDINIPLKEVASKPIDLDTVYSSIKQDPQNAKVSVVGNTLSYTEAVTGRDIDKNQLSDIVNDLNSKKEGSKVLPVKYIPAQLGLDTLKPKVLRDTLATYTTQYYRGDQNNDNRAYNIELAVKKISGKILAPGETFSFNKVVGSRTEADGYKVAHVFSGGQIVDDVGGGICQVSSTLFNAALYSNLGVVERTNHMFTVGYVPIGQDAAVAYDYVDMKFKNTSDYPVKIVGETTSDNRVIFSIIGTNDYPGRRVEIQNNTIKTIDFPTKYIDDSNMATGTSIIKSYGMDGCVVETFKTVKDNGNIISQEKLFTSSYDALSQEVIRGTGTR